MTQALGMVGMLCVLAASLGRHATAAEEDPLLALPVPLMTVVKTPKAPTIDGKLAPGEWRYAASTPGFLNLADGNLAAEQTVVSMTYDEHRLYFAFECVLTTERFPAVSESRRDRGVWGDESLELFMQLPGHEGNEFYQFVGNSIGTIFDRYNRDKSWDARWQFAEDPRPSTERGGST